MDCVLDNRRANVFCPTDKRKTFPWLRILCQIKPSTCKTKYFIRYLPKYQHNLLYLLFRANQCPLVQGKAVSRNHIVYQGKKKITLASSRNIEKFIKYKHINGVNKHKEISISIAYFICLVSFLYCKIQHEIVQFLLWCPKILRGKWDLKRWKDGEASRSRKCCIKLCYMHVTCHETIRIPEKDQRWNCGFKSN